MKKVWQAVEIGWTKPKEAPADWEEQGTYCYIKQHRAWGWLPDNEDDGILNAFTATVNPTKGIVNDVDEGEEFVESKFEKMGWTR